MKLDRQGNFFWTVKKTFGILSC